VLDCGERNRLRTQELLFLDSGVPVDEN